MSLPRVLFLLAISAFLNYFDRVNLSAGATNIRHDLGLSSYRLGKLLSAFFWTYCSLSTILDRRLAGRPLQRLLDSGGRLLFWSCATAVSGAANAFAVLFGMRLLLGMGESIAYPAYSRILASYFPEHRRGFANAVIDAGTKMGPALGTLLGGLLMAKYGWRAFFLALGFGSLLWLIPWLLWMPRGKGVSAREDSGGPRASALFCASARCGRPR